LEIRFDTDQVLQTDKPVGELARALLSSKRPLSSVNVMVCMYDCDCVERYPVQPYFTLPMQTSLLYAAKRGGMLTFWKLPKLCQSVVVPPASLPVFYAEW